MTVKLDEFSDDPTSVGDSGNTKNRDLYGFSLDSTSHFKLSLPGLSVDLVINIDSSSNTLQLDLVVNVDSRSMSDNLSGKMTKDIDFSCRTSKTVNIIRNS